MIQVHNWVHYDVLDTISNHGGATEVEETLPTIPTVCVEFTFILPQKNRMQQKHLHRANPTDGQKRPITNIKIARKRNSSFDWSADGMQEGELSGCSTVDKGISTTRAYAPRALSSACSAW
ncbi:hypothetical protein J6590_004412 [Homalodisca vitripennis]|nr:hypothetical protein J6590_004412 [Homalodisca vitripennis]